MEIGTGHVMRCLTLAERLSDQGAQVSFICREHPGHLCALIIAKGYHVFRLPPPHKNKEIFNILSHTGWLGVSMMTDARQTKELLNGHFFDLLIVDHYGINANWESSLRSKAKKIMVIDDLADRKHECNYLLDQNDLEPFSSRYHSLVPSYCKTFLGPSYALLRSEFYKHLPENKIRSGAVKRVILFFGGIDQTNETGKALAAFMALGRQDTQVDVVVGQNNRYKHELASMCNLHENLHFHCQVNNMAELMSRADLSIGAGGTTTWERLFLGLPSIIISIAANQEKICEDLSKEKLIIYLGKKESVDQQLITLQLKYLIENDEERSEMSRLSYLLFKDAINNQQLMLKELFS
ncbi:UDP-2,4-diacetamido-2,4,6-trideoxy-beta-L-altropyranose hydrolase [bacterium LRH843]|nr:UDP-2,4-diacetamido-2,4,6-trideoxy-beta-L-altropyranose hydrolase [bacterium LRH843]